MRVFSVTTLTRSCHKCLEFSSFPTILGGKRKNKQVKHLEIHDCFHVVKNVLPDIHVGENLVHNYLSLKLKSVLQINIRLLLLSSH